jgi:hypothetical protein
MRKLLVLGLLLMSLIAPVAAQRQVAFTDGVATGVVSDSGVLAKGTSVNLNAVADTSLSITPMKYIVRKFVVTNCSGTPVLAQVALYTGAGATGTTVVTAAVITSLSGSTKFVDMTITAVADTLSAATLYVRNAVAQGSALTCDVYIIGDVLP